MFLGLKMPCYLLDACYCVCVCESRIQVFKWFLIELRYRTQWWEANLRVGQSWVPNTFLRAYLNSEPKLERTLYSWFLDHITRWQLHLIFPLCPHTPKKKKKKKKHSRKFSYSSHQLDSACIKTWRSLHNVQPRDFAILFSMPQVIQCTIY